MKKLRDLCKKYREQILYVVFGGGTTLVNIASYWLLKQIGCSTGAATVLAWFFSVLFAYVTNKIFVFESRDWHVKTILREAFSFCSCRALTGLLDLGIMLLFVDVLGWPDLPVKIASNVIVIVLNYVASKLLIFRKKSSGPERDRDPGE